MKLHEFLIFLKEVYGVESIHIGNVCGIKRTNAWNYYVKRSKDNKPIRKDVLDTINNYIHKTYKGLEDTTVY